MEIINLNKKVYSKEQYKRVIDTNFSQLGTTVPPNQTVNPTISVEEFFQLYNEIFFQIPKEGETNSHEYLIKTSSEYVDSDIINSDIQALIDEINILQQQNLELNQQLIELQITGSSDLTSLVAQIESTREVNTTQDEVPTQTQLATRGRG